MSPGAERPTAWTVGHATRPVEELIELLTEQRVGLLIDVRTLPRSRTNPQFNRETLPDTLRAAEIAYRHERGLGGLRKPAADSINSAWRNASFRGYADHMQSAEFARLASELAELATRERFALMCAETVPWRCHRSLIADALTIRGVQVMHVLGRSRVQSHRMTPFARVVGDRVTYPGLV